MLPVTATPPPFTLTRASHASIRVTDLGRSRDFYRDVIGLVVTAETRDTVYLRGLEEAAHHSLVLRRTDGPPVADRVGFRVRGDDDILAAEEYFTRRGIAHRRVERDHQGPTLHFEDPVGNHMELTSSMDVVDRRLQSFDEYRSGFPQRLDHFQLVSYDVAAATSFYADLGMRLAEYTATDGEDELWGTWLEVKGNTHDLVMTNGRGPRLHHFAYTVPDVTALMHAADVAGSLGAGDEIDRGPGRHGISNAVFLYLRDPDQHRIELFTAHYQFIDLETPPQRWDLSDTRRSQLWGLPATRRWFLEASEYDGQPVRDPSIAVDPRTLDDLLALH